MLVERRIFPERIYFKEIEYPHKTNLIQYIRDYREQDLSGDNRTVNNERKGWYSNPIDSYDDTLQSFVDFVDQQLSETGLNNVFCKDLDLKIHSKGTYETVYLKHGHNNALTVNYWLYFPLKLQHETAEVRIINPNTYATPLYEKFQPMENMLLATPSHLLYEMLPYHEDVEAITVTMNYEWKDGQWHH